MSPSPPVLQQPFRLRADSPRGDPKLTLSLLTVLSSRPFRVIALGLCAIITFFFIAPRLLNRTDVQDILNTERLQFLKAENIASYVHKPWESHSAKVDWSRFAYTQYATNEQYLCNSVMIFEALDRLHSKADRLLMFPQEWSGQETMDQTTNLLRKAQSYGAKLQPIEVLRRTSENHGDLTWSESFTKLLAFNQTQYDRVLNLDSDSTILQNMDELFLAPHAPLAAPRGYWLNQEERILSSQLLLIEPSNFEFSRIMNAIEHRGADDYDMNVVTNLYRDNAMILPHRIYDLITGELRVGKDANHTGFLGSEEEKWDADKAIREAMFVHFSDWPINKPWQETPEEVLPNWIDMCTKDDGKEDYACSRNRDIWRGLFIDFKERRKVSNYQRHTDNWALCIHIALDYYMWWLSKALNIRNNSRARKDEITRISGAFGVTTFLLQEEAKDFDFAACAPKLWTHSFAAFKVAAFVLFATSPASRSVSDYTAQSSHREYKAAWGQGGPKLQAPDSLAPSTS
ncbi:MAG: hypothetical protein M1812_002070 [Candelaria pacifica]|nr:MAG: hypothetical protein M1812_002070 [Candelaria pacifica]